MLHKNFWAGRRVLITGHTGFKGSWLSLWLLSLGADVWGFALAAEGERNLFDLLDFEKTSLHHHQGDLRNFESLKQLVQEAQPEVVFHLAAQPLVTHSYYDPIGTWATNVQGSIHLLEALRTLQHTCAVVMVTTDKVYCNMEWDYGYREDDRLGGHDPYSASKAACELAISSWRSSFCGTSQHQTPHLLIATARAGNVIGGGDWAEGRIVPDVMRALYAGNPVALRSPYSTRPWQHVLEPLGAYMLLAERLFTNSDPVATAFNFGPSLDSNRQVFELAEAVLHEWPGQWLDCSQDAVPHEASRLYLNFDKAYHQLGWYPRWNFSTTVARTVDWYRSVFHGANAWDCCSADLYAYSQHICYVN